MSNQKQARRFSGAESSYSVVEYDDGTSRDEATQSHDELWQTTITGWDGLKKVQHHYTIAATLLGSSNTANQLEYGCPKLGDSPGSAKHRRKDWIDRGPCKTLGAMDRLSDCSPQDPVLSDADKATFYSSTQNRNRSLRPY